MSQWLIALGVKFMFKKIRAALAKKAVGAFSSATVGTIGVLALLAEWLVNHPEVFAALGPFWQQVAVGAAAFLLVIARARTLGK
jgi:hypothetical protein